MAIQQDMKVWQELYQAAGEIEKHAPWTYLSNEELIRITLQDGTEGFFSVLGNAGELFGINFYVGEAGLISIRKMLAGAAMGVDGMESVHEQDCISLFWGDREEVSDEQYAVIRKLGLKFRGRGNWIYFQRFCSRYAPRFLSAEDTLCMLEGMKKLLLALELYENRASSRLSIGPVILAYDPEENQKELIRLPFPDGYPLEEIGEPDSQQIFTLKKAARKKSGVFMEAAVIYGSDVIKDDNGEQYYLRLALLADHDTGLMIHTSPLQPHESAGQVLTDEITEWAAEHGAPSAVVVETEIARRQLEAVCRQLKTDLRVGNLPAVDTFAASLGIPRPAMTEGMAAMIGDVLDYLGIDPEELHSLAEDMPEEEFAAFLQGEISRRLKEKKLDDSADPEEKEFLSMIGELLQGEEEDEDWDDEEDGEWWEDAMEEQWLELSSRSAKEKALRNFFSHRQIAGTEVAPFYDRYINYTLSDRPRVSALLEGKKEQLLQTAKGMGLKVGSAAPKGVLAGMILSACQDNDDSLKLLLSPSAYNLLGYVQEAARRNEEDLYDIVEDDFEEFAYSVQDVLELLSNGLIDLDCSWNEEDEITLEIMAFQPQVDAT